MLRWGRWNWPIRKSYLLPPIRLNQALEHPSLLLHLAVIGQQAQAIFERVEFKLPAHVVTVPIREPADALLDCGRHRNFQPLGLLRFGEAFDAGVEFPRPDRLAQIARVRADQRRIRR
jgi:hypothetical protein